MLQYTLEKYKSIDFLGSKVEPTLDFEKQVKIYFGTGLSIPLLLFALLEFGFFGFEIITKKKVRSTQSLLNTEKSIFKLSDFSTMLYFQ